MLQKVTLTNGEKVRGCAITLYDAKGKAIVDLPPGTTVDWALTDGAPTIAQITKTNDADPRAFDVTTEGDDPGVVVGTATVKLADGTQLMDSDGNPPAIEITVTNSAPNSASVSVGTVEAE